MLEEDQGRKFKGGRLVRGWKRVYEGCLKGV